MNVQLNREIKAYCSDFAPVRQALLDVGAVFVEVKEQVDYYYHLPDRGDPGGTRRLKLRIERGKGELIYYYDRQERRSQDQQLSALGDGGVPGQGCA